jgi:hypothetical protein
LDLRGSKRAFAEPASIGDETEMPSTPGAATCFLRTHLEPSRDIKVEPFFTRPETAPAAGRFRQAGCPKLSAAFPQLPAALSLGGSTLNPRARFAEGRADGRCRSGVRRPLPESDSGSRRGPIRRIRRGTTPGGPPAEQPPAGATHFPGVGFLHFLLFYSCARFVAGGARSPLPTSTRGYPRRASSPHEAGAPASRELGHGLPRACAVRTPGC